MHERVVDLVLGSGDDPRVVEDAVPGKPVLIEEELEPALSDELPAA